MSMKFEVWLNDVDHVARDEIGLSIYDIEDHNWRDLYDDEYSPEEAWDNYKAEGDLFFE